IVLRGVGKNGFIEARIASVNRFEDGEGRQGLRLARDARRPPARRGDDHEAVVDRRRNRGDGQPDHRDTSVTPQITSAAPAQRNPLTRSLRRYFANTVSIT